MTSVIVYRRPETFPDYTVILPVVGCSAVLLWFGLFIVLHVIPSLNFVLYRRRRRRAARYWVAQRARVRLRRAEEGLPPLGEEEEGEVEGEGEGNSHVHYNSDTYNGSNNGDNTASSTAPIDNLMFGSALFYYSENTLARSSAVSISVNNGVISFCDAAGHAQHDSSDTETLAGAPDTPVSVVRLNMVDMLDNGNNSEVVDSVELGDLASIDSMCI